MEKVLKTREAKIAILLSLFLYILLAVTFCYDLGKSHNIFESAVNSISTLIPIILIQVGSFIVLLNIKNKN
jgi:pantothenate kinase